MDTRTARRPRSRGDKAPLTLDAVVDAALACLKEDGAPGLTMRKVATRLDTGAGSLYAYVRDQRELYVLVLDAIADEVAATSGTAELSAANPGTEANPGKAQRGTENADSASNPNWRDELIQLLVDYAEALTRYPGAATLAMAAPPTGPRSLDLTERALGLLLAGGLAPAQAAIACDPLFLLVIATIAEQDSQHAQRPEESIADSYQQALDANPERYPRLAAARTALFAGDGPGRLRWTLDALLTGALAKSNAVSVEDVEALEEFEMAQDVTAYRAAKAKDDGTRISLDELRREFIP